ncbi:multidrug effflux MFS transporter [Streptomyces sp. J2-1]|nr:multidrug effflux MFS transporter [Streptomyces corallincola]
MDQPPVRELSPSARREEPEVTPDEAAPRTAVTGDGVLHGKRWKLVLLLGALVAIGPLTTDMYLPALPAISDQLHAGAAAVQLTLTATLAGLALGQLLVGPLSDAVGRRLPLLVGVAVHIVASALCSVAPNLALLDVLRVVQGLGAATSTVITMAIVRDLYDGSAAATLLSRLMLVLGVAPILAPTIGGAVLAGTSWRGIFLLMALLSLVIILITARALPETLPVERRRSGGVRNSMRDYGQLLHDRVFIGLILLAGLAMSTIFAFVSGSPFVFQDHFGLSEQQFALVFGSGSIWVIVATQLNVRLLRRWSPMRVLVTAVIAATAAGVLLLALSAADIGGMTGVLLPLWLALFATGFAMPNAPALALSRHGHFAGTAAALLGAVQFGIGALTAPVVGLIGTGPAAMAGVITGGLVIGLLVLVTLVRPWQHPATTDTH